MASGQHKSNVLFSIFKFLNIIFLCLLGTSYIAYYINPSDFWSLAFFSLLYPYFLIFNILFVLLWILLRKKFAVFSLILILAGFNHLGRLVRITKTDISQGSEAVKVLSYNVQNYYSLYERQNSTDIDMAKDSLIQFIKEENPDLICFQEFPLKISDIKDQLGRISSEVGCKYYFFSKYYTNTRILSGLTILSRYPVITTKTISFNKKTIALYTDLKLLMDTVRLFNIHLASVNLMHSDYTFLSDLKKSKTDSLTGLHFKNVLSKLKDAYVKRGLQVEVLHNHINSSPYPVILCGDFNDTPNSYTYHKISGSLEDAFIKSGRGFGNTMANDFLPSFRIDYIFYNPAIFTSAGYKTGKYKFSDHFPVSCYLLPARNSE
ncbi:MAG: endonuclease/exonuclease/phosphatase family protein [Bacteroidales bacterium]|nr:endonuclease/exonuclease/phosphatase family protein [Bacteroidales bacterium]